MLEESVREVETRLQHQSKSYETECRVESSERSRIEYCMGFNGIGAVKSKGVCGRAAEGFQAQESS
jgi:hypothetical protein